jgi:hypothetical protein
MHAPALNEKLCADSLSPSLSPDSESKHTASESSAGAPTLSVPETCILVQVCKGLGVPLQVVPLTQQYWQRVVEDSISDIKAGRTPNPDILCNSRFAAPSPGSAPSPDGSPVFATLQFVDLVMFKLNIK